MLNDKVCEVQLLILGSFLETSLHDTAAMLVLANLDAVVHTGIEDELSVLRSDLTALRVDISWVF